MSKLKQYLILPYALYQDGYTGKLLVAFVTANILIPIASFVEEYMYSDWDFLFILMVILPVDAFLGGWKHFKLGTFDLEHGFKKFTSKMGVIFAFLVLFHGLIWIVEPSNNSTIIDYLRMLKRLMVFSYIGWSGMESLYVISNKKFPPEKWMKKFKLFKESTDINDLK